MPSRDHVALYSVLVDGGEIAQEFRDRIKEIVVVDHLRLPDSCTIVLSFPKAEGIDEQPFKIGGKLELRLGAKDEQASETLFRGDVVALEPEFGAGGCGLTVRCYDRAHLLHRSAQGARLPEPDGDGHRQEGRVRERPDLRRRRERRSARLRPAGQPDRLGLHLGPGRALRLRVRRERPDGAVPPARARRHGRAGVAGRADVLPPARHRRAAGERGDAARPRPQDQAGDRELRHAARAGGEHRPRPRRGHGCLRRRHPARRHRAGQEPRRGRRADAGAARQAGQRLHRRRGRRPGQPARSAPA